MVLSFEYMMLGSAALLAGFALLRNKAAVVGTGYTRADARAHPKPKQDTTISGMRFKFGKAGDPVPTSGAYSGLEPGVWYKKMDGAYYRDLGSYTIND